MQVEKGIITGHFMSHWGIPKEIRTRNLRGIGEFAILEFAPKGERTTWRYATNGMSSYTQYHPDELVNVRSEIYGCTRSQSLWIDDLLAAIAAYPYDYNTYLSEGDTINVGQPIDREGSCFTAILLARPGLCDSETLGLVKARLDNVLIQQVIGILPAEAEFAERHGGKTLWEKLAKEGDLTLDRNRPPVV